MWKNGPAILIDEVLVLVAQRQEHAAFDGERHPGGDQRFGVRLAERATDAHHLARRVHLGAEHDVLHVEAPPREHRRLDEAHAAAGRDQRPEIGEALAEAEARGERRQRERRRLRDERHGARGARVHFEHVELALVDGELDVHQSDGGERARDPRGGRDHLRAMLGAEHHGREHGRRVPRVHARLLDVLEDAGDVDLLAVRERVEVVLDGALEEPVDENRLVLARGHGLLERVLDVLDVVADAHAAPAEHVRRSDEEGKPDVTGGEASSRVVAIAPSGWRISSRVASALKRSRSSQTSMASADVPRMGPIACDSLSGVCPPNWSTTPRGFSRSMTFCTCSSVTGSK
jgi:hypothetical protein